VDTRSGLLWRGSSSLINYYYYFNVYALLLFTLFCNVVISFFYRCVIGECPCKFNGVKLFDFVFCPVMIENSHSERTSFQC
jgi:hypothetical protein